MITCNQHLGNSIRKRLLFLTIKGFQNCQIPLIRSKEKNQLLTQPSHLGDFLGTKFKASQTTLNTLLSFEVITNSTELRHI